MPIVKSLALSMTSMGNINLSRFQKLFAFVFYFSIFLFAAMLFIGLPIEFSGHTLKIKNFRIPSILLLVSGTGIMLCHPGGLRAGLKSLETTINQFADRKSALWIVYAAASFIFTWQQVSEFLSLKINFLPFSFYDYMLHYFFQGKINFTGLLHTWYHTNNSLYLLAPFWRLFKSPLWLVILYGPLTCLAIIPVWKIAQMRFKQNAAALLCALVFLSSRYLQNILQMNFSPEVVYSITILSAVYAALSSKWKLYYVMVFLGLLTKEDSFVYFAAVGALVFFINFQKNRFRFSLEMLHGVATGILAVAYFIVLTKVFMPLTGNNVLSESMNNYEGHVGQGSSPSDLILHLIKKPTLLGDIFFGDPSKLKTYQKLLLPLCFLPLASPSILLIFFPLFLLFSHSTGRDADFYELRFHYAGAVIPFITLSFIFGFSNLILRISAPFKKPVFWSFFALLLILNVGTFRIEKVTQSNLESIAMAISIPKKTNLVTHGHLLPYIGYRDYNYYFAQPFELPEHSHHVPFSRADYYLIDLNVNLYPMDEAYFRQKISDLNANPEYNLLHQENQRWLFKRKKSHGH